MIIPGSDIHEVLNVLKTTTTEEHRHIQQTLFPQRHESPDPGLYPGEGTPRVFLDGVCLAQVNATTTISPNSTLLLKWNAWNHNADSSVTNGTSHSMNQR